MNDKYISIIESELKRIEFIVNELLVLSKPQTTHISKPVDLLSLLEQVTTLMNGQAALKISRSSLSVLINPFGSMVRLIR